ncbi:hypothetical protein C8255_02685 [filamentous cyanobacterium CCP3]|nr:hypothetical protein C8255_02685 [filamentous cyanobacterium CCP3]
MACARTAAGAAETRLDGEFVFDPVLHLVDQGGSDRIHRALHKVGLSSGGYIKHAGNIGSYLRFAIPKIELRDFKTPIL